MVAVLGLNSLPGGWKGAGLGAVFKFAFKDGAKLRVFV